MAKGADNLPKLSAEMVQQLDFQGSTTNLQISTNVTVKAMNPSLKSDVEDKKPNIVNQNPIASTPPTHPTGALPTINSPSMPTQINTFKEEQREFLDDSEINFSLDNLSNLDEEDVAAFLSQFSANLKDSKDGIFSSPNHHQQQPPPPQPPPQTLQSQRQQLVHHHHQAPSFHQTPIKMEDVNKNNVLPNQQQHMHHFMQQPHQMHPSQHMQHQPPHPSASQQIQVCSCSFFLSMSRTQVHTFNEL